MNCEALGLSYTNTKQNRIDIHISFPLPLEFKAEFSSRAFSYEFFSYFFLLLYFGVIRNFTTTLLFIKVW